MPIKRIMRYLRGTQDYSLWYKKGRKFELKSFIDFDWAGRIDERKRINKEHYFLEKG